MLKSLYQASLFIEEDVKNGDTVLSPDKAKLIWRLPESTCCSSSAISTYAQ